MIVISNKFIFHASLCMPMGIIVEAEGKTIYHTGDTGLFSDMKLIADRHPVDVCFVPIGDNFTMGIEDGNMLLSVCHSL